MTKTINIADEHVPELIEIYGADWSAQILNEEGVLIDNPETKAVFANNRLTVELRDSIRYRVLKYRKAEARNNVDTTDITED